MILSENHIYDKLESFRNQRGYSQEKMAEIMGLSNKQAYSNMVKKKTMKMIYFINLINKTGLSAYEFFKDIEDNKASDVKMQYFSCPDCIEKQKKIDNLEHERDDFRNKYIECLEDFRELTSNRKRASG